MASANVEATIGGRIATLLVVFPHGHTDDELKYDFEIIKGWFADFNSNALVRTPPHQFDILNLDVSSSGYLQRAPQLDSLLPSRCPASDVRAAPPLNKCDAYISPNRS